MQLSQKSPVFQCQAEGHDGNQCPRQSIGYRRYNGELYFACLDHIRDKNYKPATVLPDTPRIWNTGHKSSGKYQRG